MGDREKVVCLISLLMSGVWVKWIGWSVVAIETERVDRPEGFVRRGSNGFSKRADWEAKPWLEVNPSGHEELDGYGDTPRGRGNPRRVCKMRSNVLS
jgi:hypothetical protein